MWLLVRKSVMSLLLWMPEKNNQFQRFHQSTITNFSLHLLKMRRFAIERWKFLPISFYNKSNSTYVKL
jgi:hypothetical protein